MAMLCSAYGMRLSCSFPIEGMTPCEQPEDGLPALALDRRTRPSSERAWQGTGEEPRWRGRLGDGMDLTIEDGAAGDTLFGYSGGARFSPARGHGPPGLRAEQRGP